MMQDENLAGYDQLSPGADDVSASAVDIAPVLIPELKSLFRLAAGAVGVAALYF